MGEADHPQPSPAQPPRPGRRSWAGEDAAWEGVAGFRRRPRGLAPRLAPASGGGPGPRREGVLAEKPPVGSAGGGAAPGPGERIPPSPGERGRAPHLPPWRSSQGSPLGLSGGLRRPPRGRGPRGRSRHRWQGDLGASPLPPLSYVPESRGQRPSLNPERARGSPPGIPGSLLRRRLSCSSPLASLPFSSFQSRGVR